MSLDQVFDRQHRLQVDAFGIDPAGLEGPAFAEFIRWNVLALEDELHEVLAETDWKPWSDVQGRKSDSRAPQELADCLHFYVNLCLAFGVTPESLVREYLAKADVNAERQRVGYTKARELEASE